MHYHRRRNEYSDPGTTENRPTTHPCEVTEVNDIGFTVRFEKPQFAPCPGQKLVVYNDTEDVVAGGTIEVFS
ncbi:MAG: aminomethyltransferase beta-barrel domain-containing protein [Planctomycetota bacterium]